jgi:hypothetical protein
MRSGYLDLLRAATSEKAVVQIARSYLSEWSPAELASIPAACRLATLADGESLADFALNLTRARIDSRGPQALLEEMESFFARSCAKLSDLEAPHRLSERSYLTR